MSDDQATPKAGLAPEDVERDNIIAFLLNRAEWLRQECLKGGSCGVEQQQAQAMAEMIAKGRHRRPESCALPNWRPQMTADCVGAEGLEKT